MNGSTPWKDTRRGEKKRMLQRAVEWVGFDFIPTIQTTTTSREVFPEKPFALECEFAVVGWAASSARFSRRLERTVIGKCGNTRTPDAENSSVKVCARCKEAMPMLGRSAHL